MITKNDVIKIADEVFNFLIDSSSTSLFLTYSDIIRIKIEKTSTIYNTIKIGKYEILYEVNVKEYSVIIKNKKKETFYQRGKYADGSVLVELK